MTLEFKDLTYRYPKQHDKHFQRKFSERYEFRELSLPRHPTPRPPRGELYPHQRLMERFLNIWDEVLTTGEPGIGKTGSIYGPAISFNEHRNLSPEDAYLSGYCNWIRQTYIIVPNETLVLTWKAAYYTYSGTKIIPSNIHIITRDIFYTQFNKLEVSELIQRFSNSFFAVDEVQDLLNRSKATDKAKYEWYRFFFRVIPNIKLIVATGTPIIENAHELGLTMNLLPGVDMPTVRAESKVALDDPWWETVTEAEMASYLGGRVSHVKNIQDKAVLVYPPSAVPLDDLIEVGVPNNIKVVPVVLSELQSQLYYKVSKGNNPFNVQSLNAALSVIPPGVREKTYIRDVRDNIDYAREVAAKLVAALEIIQKSKGIVFVVSRYVEASGNILEQILNGNGYEEYVVGGKGKRTTGVKLPQTKGQRYVVIRSQTPFNTAILNIVGQYPNRHGEYVKIVLTARVGSVGVTVPGVTTYIALDPDAHMSGDIQREKRMFRPGAHDILYEERLAQGYSPEEAVIKVKAYRLVAIPVRKGKERPEDSIDIQTYASNIRKDQHLNRIRTMSHRIAFDAQLHLQRNQCLPEDKELFAEHGLDFDTLDLTECYYGYYDEKASGVVTSTYDLLYASRQVGPVIRDLISILLIEGSITVDEFRTRLKSGSHKHNISDLGLYILIYNSLYTNPSAPPLFSDYGVRVYLGAAGLGGVASLYLQTDLNFSLGSTRPRFSPETYIYGNLMVAAQAPLDYFVSYRQKRVESVDELEQWLSSAGGRMVNAPLERKIETIEAIIVNYHRALAEVERSGDKEGRTVPTKLRELYNAVMDRYYGKTIFSFNKPTGRLLFVSGAAYSEEIRDEMDILSIPDTMGPESETVIVHILYGQISPVGRGGYDPFKSTKEAKQVSIFDSKALRWIALKPPMAEYYVYSAMVRAPVEARFAKFLTRFEASSKDADKIYGISYDPSSDFNIYDRRKPPVLTKKGEINKAMEPRGKDCSTYFLHELVDMAVTLGITPEEVFTRAGKETPPDLLLDNMTFDKKELRRAEDIVKRNAKLRKVIKDHPQFYSKLKNFILFVRWASEYTGGADGSSGGGRKGKRAQGVETSKTALCRVLNDTLRERRQFFIF